MNDGNIFFSVALDAAPTNRWKDPSTGYLHVRNNKLTRAQVDGYYGKEIMGSAGIGLEPERFYQVFRPMDEIIKGSQTLYGNPLMDEHPEGDVNADTLAAARRLPYAKQDLIPVGSIYNIRVEEPYLVGDISIYNKDAIEAVEKEEKKQLSCGYKYDPVAEGGLYEGKPYEIKMTNIRFNHLALVPKGRVGPEVSVADAAPKGLSMDFRSEVSKIVNKYADLGAGKLRPEAGASLRNLIAQAKRSGVEQSMIEKVLKDYGFRGAQFATSGDNASSASQLLGAKDAPTPGQLKEGARRELQEEAKYLRRTGQIGRARADAEKYFSTVGKYKRLWETAGRSLGLDAVFTKGKDMAKGRDADDPILEGEENGAVQQIKEGVEEFERIHEGEGYLPPGGLDNEAPQGEEAGTPMPGEPNLAPGAEDEDIDGEISALEAKLAELKKKKAGKDEAPPGTLPEAGGGSVGDEKPGSPEWVRYVKTAMEENGLTRQEAEADAKTFFELQKRKQQAKDEFPEVNNGSEYKGVAMDSAKMADKITKEIQERYRRRDVALDEIRPLVGDLKFSAVANDAAAYSYALKAKGVEPPKGINTAGLRGMVQALIASQAKMSSFASAMALDAAPSKKSDEYEKLFDERKTRIL